MILANSLSVLHDPKNSSRASLPQNLGSFPLLVMVYIGSSVGSPYRRRWGGRARLFRARLLRWHDGGLVASTAMAAHPRAPISTLCGVSDRMPCPASGGARGYAAAAGGGDGTLCSDAWACAPRGVRRKRRRRRSRCARPNIWRFSILRRLICPSTGPVLQGSVMRGEGNSPERRAQAGTAGWSSGRPPLR